MGRPVWHIGPAAARRAARPAAGVPRCRRLRLRERTPTTQHVVFPRNSRGAPLAGFGIQQPHMAIDRVAVQFQTPCNLPIRESLRVQLLNDLSVGHADPVRHRRLRRVEKHPGYDSRTPHHWPVFRRPSLAGFGVPADTTASLPPPTLRLLPAAMTNLPGGVHTHWKNKTFARRTPRSGSQRVAGGRAH